MPRLAICSRDLHWYWINRTLLCDTMEVSMLSRAWLTIAQHVFQPALTGRPELISRKIVSGEPGTKAIAVSRFREKLTPANWVQCVTAILRKISRSWAPKKMGSNMRPRYIQFRDIHDRDISGLHCISLGRAIPRHQPLKHIVAWQQVNQCRDDLQTSSLWYQLMYHYTDNLCANFEEAPVRAHKRMWWVSIGIDYGLVPHILHTIV